MPSVVDDTIEVLKSMSLEAHRVATPPGYAGFQVNLPNDSQAFFIWTKIDAFDYHFRLARFWANENPFSMWVSPNLIEALTKTRVMANQ